MSKSQRVLMLLPAAKRITSQTVNCSLPACYFKMLLGRKWTVVQIQKHFCWLLPSTTVSQFGKCQQSLGGGIGERGAGGWVTFQFGVNHPFKPTHFPPKNSPGSDCADETLSCGRLMAVTVCCDPGHRVKWLAVRRAHLGPMRGAATAAIQLQRARQIIAC